MKSYLIICDKRDNKLIRLDQPNSASAKTHIPSTIIKHQHLVIAIPIAPNLGRD